MTDTQQVTLASWLLEQIAADEAMARAARDDFPDEAFFRANLGEYDKDGRFPAARAEADHIARQDPAHVLAVCAAHRAIVELYEIQRERRDAYRSPRSRAIEDEKATQDRRLQEARCRSAEDAVRALASAYRSRDGFRPEWQID